MVLRKIPIQSDDTTGTLTIREGTVFEHPATPPSDEASTAGTTHDASAQQPTLDHSSVGNATELRKYDDDLAKEYTDLAIGDVASHISVWAHSSLRTDMTTKCGGPVTLPMDHDFERFIKKGVDPTISSILNDKRHEWWSEAAPGTLTEETFEAKYKNFVERELKVSQVPDNPKKFTLQYGENTEILEFPRYGYQPGGTVVPKWVKAMGLGAPKDEEKGLSSLGPSRAPTETRAPREDIFGLSTSRGSIRNRASEEDEHIFGLNIPGVQRR